MLARWGKLCKQAVWMKLFPEKASNGLHVTASLSASLCPGTARWYRLTSRLNASTLSASHPRQMSNNDHMRDRPTTQKPIHSLSWHLNSRCHAHFKDEASASLLEHEVRESRVCCSWNKHGVNNTSPPLSPHCRVLPPADDLYKYRGYK